MGAAGVFAFAPLGISSAQEQPTTTTGLGLDPKNDPVVYVTESGLEIKKSNGKYTSTTTTTTNTGKTHTQDLTSFYYFTMGTFSGTIYTAKTRTSTYEVSNEPVNWLIIGRGEFNFYDDSPAGTAIKNESSKQEIAVANNLYLPLDMQSIPEGPDNEIPDNCFLVLSEKLLGQSYFNTTGSINSNLSTDHSECYFTYCSGYYGSRYRFYGKYDLQGGTQTWTTSGNAGGSLYNYINKLFSKNASTGAIIDGCNKLGFTREQANLIQPQKLYTTYHNGSSMLQETFETDGGTYYTMFPLAYKAVSSSIYQNFCLEDYLTTNAQRTATFIGSSTNQSFIWALRSGKTLVDIGNVYPSGTLTNTRGVGNGLGVRPAMVVKIQ